MGEPAQQQMVATNDVSTISDENQVAPIEIDTDSKAQAVAQAEAGPP